jgi:5-methylcytosine-specific restriction endonuclease McrA
MSHTLALNSDYTPIGVLPLSTLHWHDAVKAVFLNTVSVLHEYDNWTVNSPSQAFRIPAVVVAREYVKVRQFVGFSADMVHLRDGYRCAYCHGRFTKENLTCDHVVPKSHKGTLTFDNIVSACGPCNCRRGNNTKIQPKVQPYRPTYHELVSKRRHHPVTIPHESWLDYIGWEDKRLVTLEQPASMPGYQLVRPGPVETDDLVRDLLLRA